MTVNLCPICSYALFQYTLTKQYTAESWSTYCHDLMSKFTNQSRFHDNTQISILFVCFYCNRPSALHFWVAIQGLHYWALLREGFIFVKKCTNKPVQQSYLVNKCICLWSGVFVLTLQCQLTSCAESWLLWSVNNAHNITTLPKASTEALLMMNARKDK